MASSRYPGIAVDIGMGTGNLCRKLAARGWFVVDVDPSPEMRKMAAKKLSDVIIVDGHFLALPIKSHVEYDLLNDLNTEYYESVQTMVKIFHDLGYDCRAEKQNKYVWIISAEKSEQVDEGCVRR